jgi:hypothetical protein
MELVNELRSKVIASATDNFSGKLFLGFIHSIVHHMSTTALRYSISEPAQSSKKKVKFALEQAMKVQRRSRCIALLFLQPWR